MEANGSRRFVHLCSASLVRYFFALYLVRSGCELGASTICIKSETAGICRGQLCRLIRNSNTRNSSKLQMLSHTPRINCQRTSNVMSAIADRIHTAADTHMLETLERSERRDSAYMRDLFTLYCSFAAFLSSLFLFLLSHACDLCANNRHSTQHSTID